MAPGAQPVGSLWVEGFSAHVAFLHRYASRISLKRRYHSYISMEKTGPSIMG